MELGIIFDEADSTLIKAVADSLNINENRAASFLICLSIPILVSDPDQPTHIATLNKRIKHLHDKVGKDKIKALIDNLDSICENTPQVLSKI